MRKKEKHHCTKYTGNIVCVREKLNFLADDLKCLANLFSEQLNSTSNMLGTFEHHSEKIKKKIWSVQISTHKT